MIKKFNLFLKNTNLLKASFSSSKSFQPQKTCKQKIPIVSFNNLKEAIQYDTSNHFFHYPYINDQFQSLIKANFQKLRKTSQHNNLENENFQKSLQALTNYPCFNFNKQSLRLFYQLILQNIHTKNPQLLENALTLMIMSDNHFQQTKLYEQFARFYVNSQLQVIKSRFSLNLQNENIIGSIKKLLMSIYQRGFFPRTPGYIRNLYITNHVLILNKMIQKESYHNSLILKRIFYQYFIQIKQLYQQEMKQNLYHEKNEILLQKLILIMKILCRSFEKKIDILQPQCKQLRQLYIKLFLVIDKPNLTNSIFMYEMIQKQCKKNDQLKNQQQKNSNKILSQQQENTKEKQNNQYLSQQIQKINNNNIQKINNINIFNEFISKVKQLINKNINYQQKQMQNKQNQSNQQYIANKQLSYKNKFTVQQMLCILSNHNNLQLKPQLINHYTQQIIKLTSPLLLNLHLQSFLYLLSQKQQQNIQKNLIKIFINIKSYELLTLEQIAKASMEKFVRQNNLVKFTILEYITTVDIKEVGTKEILYLLNVFKGTQGKQNKTINIDPLIDKIEQHRKPIINFILRFLADHHKSLQLDTYFEQILTILFNTKQNLQNNKIINKKINENLLQYDFNDSNGNYPLNILQQMYQFLDKNLWKVKNKQLKKIIKQKLQQINEQKYQK